MIFQRTNKKDHPNLSLAEVGDQVTYFDSQGAFTTRKVLKATKGYLETEPLVNDKGVVVDPSQTVLPDKVYSLWREGCDPIPTPSLKPKKKVRKKRVTKTPPKSQPLTNEVSRTKQKPSEATQKPLEASGESSPTSTPTQKTEKSSTAPHVNPLSLEDLFR